MKTPIDWHSTNWKKVYRLVNNLKRRIFRAAKKGNLKKVRSLQRLMLRSYSNALAAVRRVTQLNQGKKTPGVDKMVALKPEARAKLVQQLLSHEPWKVLPVRRIYIPKSNGKERPLGIPVIKDRAMQAIVLNALEPYWESKFEGSSYGFRPGRSCHDAIEACYNSAKAAPRQKKKWVLDADIKGAFDNICHTYLMNQLKGFPARELVRSWLRAGVVENLGNYHKVGEYTPTEQGTPQGGVVSPILANIALHGMEEVLGIRYKFRTDRQTFELTSDRAMVRYADDFVVFCKTRENAEEVKKILTEWLAIRGLIFSEDKTSIRQLKEGFDFLGFNVRHYPVKDRRSGYKLLIKPSKKSVTNHRKRLKAEWLKLPGQNINTVLRVLNPIIRGWCNYFKPAVSAKEFDSLEKYLYIRSKRWVYRNHRNKSRAWIKQRYYAKFKKGSKKIRFGDVKTGQYLLYHSDFKIERHTPVKGNYSPLDPDLRGYWQSRQLVKQGKLSKDKARLAETQEWRCPVCREPLLNGEELHKHHKILKSQGGRDSIDNLIVLHLVCHQNVHLRNRKKQLLVGQELA
ncbi:group II intron reverse transcriptase/maturase [Leptolyngbya ohadii]|uniref:group II intron reverse transcriptase/maturase n=1 Tax=Leptolyngbya ohadii TaxID=1962290 RepID=UPI001CED5F64|nr:group II intron reverse transcriptase/maturase [Leptolyngbya ohadii]